MKRIQTGGFWWSATAQSADALARFGCTRLADPKIVNALPVRRWDGADTWDWID
ncbi:MAG: hypothetical protein V3V25_05130 [Paracoccaceae bacterium]